MGNKWVLYAAVAGAVWYFFLRKKSSVSLALPSPQPGFYQYGHGPIANGADGAKTVDFLTNALNEATAGYT